MKIRLGFVSNSSAASFCVFGWQVSELAEEQIKTLKNSCKDLFTVWPPDGGEILGVGNEYSEIDHYCDDDWHDFEPDPPSKEAQQQLLDLAQKLGLSKPEMFSENYWG